MLSCLKYFLIERLLTSKRGRRPSSGTFMLEITGAEANAASDVGCGGFSSTPRGVQRHAAGPFDRRAPLRIAQRGDSCSLYPEKLLFLLLSADLGTSASIVVSGPWPCGCPYSLL